VGLIAGIAEGRVQGGREVIVFAAIGNPRDQKFVTKTPWMVSASQQREYASYFSVCVQDRHSARDEW